jgi:lysyl endopeptidase
MPYTAQAGGLNQSANCHINVACPQGAAYQDQANSTAMVLLPNQTEWCSSTLLNNTCNNFRPYMLTAFHCLDIGGAIGTSCDGDYGNGNLSQVEINNAQNFGFRFQFRSPNCSPSTAPAFTFFYPGATFRAANFNTDFALMEMNTVPSPASNIRYAGWTRDATPPTSMGILGHPNGDVMKIARANAPALNTGLLLVQNPCFLQAFPVNTQWQVTLTDGATEGGMSGGGWFNQDGRLFAQHHGGSDPVCATPRIPFAGAFHQSWNGGGSANTRLSDWLDPAGTGAITTNQLVTIPSVSGPTFFCTTAQFTFNNAPPGATITWSVSPSSAVSPSSGTGTVANVTAAGNANATITFRVSCGNGAPFNYNFHVGDYSSSNYPVSGPSNAGCFQTVYYSTNQLPGATSYTWFWPSNWTYISGQGTNQLAVQTGGSGSSGTVGVRVGACGGSGGSPATRFTSVNCSFRLAADVFPNPASEQVEIVGGKEVPGEGRTRSVLIPDVGNYEALLYNAVGNLVRSGTSTNGKLSFNVQQLPNGVYTLRLDDGSGKPITKRVVIAH